jgi:hypothetical protein
VIDEAAITLRDAVCSGADERGRRRFAAAEARTAGRGGVFGLTRLTGLARSTIDRGLRELAGTAADEAASGRVRRAGGGRKKVTDPDPTLLAHLQSLVEPTTRGYPMALLLWTSRSMRNLADALQVTGHIIKHNVVAARWMIYPPRWSSISPLRQGQSPSHRVRCSEASG